MVVKWVLPGFKVEAILDKGSAPIQEIANAQTAGVGLVAAFDLVGALDVRGYGWAIGDV
jgi:hypothetical protein